MRVHIEGMGLQGALLADLLDLHGVDFTWHDTDEARVAWQASTGAVYPSGSSKFGPDEACRAVWAHWHDTGLWAEHLEESAWVFSTLRPPHGGRYAFAVDPSGLRVAEESSYHLNAQSLVPAARSRFSERRLIGAPPRADLGAYIVSHGWGARLSHVYWGWTRLVQLRSEIDTPMGLRPAFYFREGRFVMAYAYPVPGTPWWYAGSSIIKQRPDRRRSLEVEAKYERWRENFLRLGRGAVRIEREGPCLEGWRPAASAADIHWIREQRSPRRGRVLMMRPLWNSGIRHFPRQWQGVADALGLGVEPEEEVG